MPHEPRSVVLATKETSPHDLVELIYSALMGEATWQQFLDAAGRLFDDGKAILFYHDVKHQHGRFLVTSGFDEGAIKRYAEYYSSKNCWVQKAQARPIGIASHSSSLMPREQLLRTEFYNDFLKHANIASGFGITICRDADCNFMLSVLGEDLDDSEIRRRLRTVQVLMPHLERASQLYRRGTHGFSAAGGGRELDALSIGLIRVGLSRKINYANRSAQLLLAGKSALSTDALGRLTCEDDEFLQLVEAMLRNWQSPAASLEATPFILVADEQPLPIKVTVVPPPRDEALNFFRGPECTLLLELPRMDVKAPIAMLCKNFKLTSAEATVVEGLASGLSLKDIAGSRAVAMHTVRAQLKSVFAKTGFRSQADLIRHLAALAS
jgi:DNA-binding CsgD family transcriptional regulator